MVGLGAGIVIGGTSGGVETALDLATARPGGSGRRRSRGEWWRGSGGGERSRWLAVAEHLFILAPASARRRLRIMEDKVLG